jgi:hypothetical protein
VGFEPTDGLHHLRFSRPHLDSRKEESSHDLRPAVRPVDPHWIPEGIGSPSRIEQAPVERDRPLAPELTLFVDRWQNLPEAVRAAVVAMDKASLKPSASRFRGRVVLCRVDGPDDPSMPTVLIPKPAPWRSSPCVVARISSHGGRGPGGWPDEAVREIGIEATSGAKPSKPGRRPSFSAVPGDRPGCTPTGAAFFGGPLPVLMVWLTRRSA